MARMFMQQQGYDGRPQGPSTPAPTRGPFWRLATYLPSLLCFLFTFILTLLGTRQRLQRVRKEHVSLNPFIVFKATVRGHLAYTYHLCRHLTRYYTLPLLVISLLIPPLLLLTFLLCGIVIGTDYVRLRPNMGVGEYALCSVLDDCAYEVGVLWGCVKHRTWKPLVPMIKKKVS